jgi:hypothetical protein
MLSNSAPDKLKKRPRKTRPHSLEGYIRLSRDYFPRLFLSALEIPRFRTHVSAVADVRIPKMKQQLKGDAKNAIKDGVNEGADTANTKL